MKIPSIRIIGDDSQAGTYVLRICLKEDTTLQFGRFKKGKLISMILLELALSEKGATIGTQHGVVINPHMSGTIRRGLGNGNLLLRHGKKTSIFSWICNR